MLFNANNIRKSKKITRRMVRKHIRDIKYMIKFNARQGKDKYIVWGDSEWFRTFDRWTPYFTQRGFRVEYNSGRTIGTVTISW